MLFPRPHRALRRASAVAIAGLLCLLLLPSASRADNPSTLTVVGTSDVQDSGLIPDLIKPMFEKAFPQYTLNYVSVGTGVAISDAESGVASALLVHAASLENQFVQQGYSKEKYGRAIFYGDYVLLGPKSDPAGVLSGAPHDVAAAFAKIASAGAAGKADFVSRGGTPGTTVQEHAIWALDAGSPGLTLCTVSAKNGGGDAPSTAAGNCPTSTSNPSWYHTTGLTQGPNIEAANTCNFPNAAGNGNDCYALTDRGTFDCLMSASCAGGAGTPANLQIVARDNSASAKGGNTLLVNSFHAYAINPAKFAGNSNVQLNTTAAEDFLNVITSPSFQSQLKSYLGSTNDPPFTADAAPSITATGFKRRVTGGQKLTVKGTIANVVPGTPALANQTVTVSEVGGGVGAGIPVASTKTNPNGAYTIRFTPPSSGSYQVTTGQIQQIENSSLNPVFGDILQPGATAATKLTVHGAIRGLRVSGRPGSVLATGLVKPGFGHLEGSVTLLARRGRKGAFEKIATERLSAGDGKFAIGARRGAGTWSFKVRFQDPGQIATTTSGAKRATVAAVPRVGVRITSLTISHGRFTLSGALSHPPNRSSVEVLALDAGALPKPATKTLAAAGAEPGRVTLKPIVTFTVKPGTATFSVKGRLRRGQHWIVGVKYAADGRGTAYSPLRSVRVT